MGSRIKHAAGSFCWVELTTTDAAGAKAFYTDLLDWQTHDDPIPGGGVYTMIRHAGGDVGALYEQTPEMRSQGMPAMWMPYVTVDDVRETAAAARRLGGSVVKDAFDVMQVGSMAVLRDPTGAVLALWQPKMHTGFDYDDGRTATVCWNELATNDVEAAARFYTELFGWRAEKKDMGRGPYTIFHNGDTMAAGLLEMPDACGDAPPSWTAYFAVADCDATAGRVEALRGRVLAPPADIPTVGRFSVCRDPQGATFAVIHRGGDRPGRT